MLQNIAQVFCLPSIHRKIREIEVHSIDFLTQIFSENQVLSETFLL